MKKKIRSSSSSGFTLTEVLATVAILVILLGISAVAVSHSISLLKITELDNAAREIYLAAEHRAVLLSSGRRLHGLVSQSGNTVQLSVPYGEEATGAWYISQQSEALSDLLPEGSIDPALRDGYFYIVYEPVSGCVTDVFYAESAINTLGESDFQAFYDKWTAADRESRRQSSPMLGYYSGGRSQGSDFDRPQAPVPTVRIDNAEQLTVTVTRWIPNDLPADSVSLHVELNCGGKTVVLTDSSFQSRRTEGPSASDAHGVTHTSVWVLDALDDGMQFSKLLPPGTPLGDAFTVTATLSPSDGSFQPVSDSDTDNSLFAEESSGTDTAYLKYLRHLQNLNETHSGVTTVTKAVQVADISCADYEFIPIQNGRLASYQGQSHEIRDLCVTAQSAAGQAAGLFSTAGPGMTFSDIRLVNASVEAGPDRPAGALAGEALNAAFARCWVYWEPEAGQSNLRSLLGSDEEGKSYRYQIVGSYAGGLVGQLTSGSITSCLAATTVSGSAAAGGLAGRVQGSADVNISTSYADCYLAGDRAAGLVGSLNAVVSLTSCYAAGFLQAGTSAGLCLGEGGKVEAQSVYSAVRPEQGGRLTWQLTQQELVANNDSFFNTFYLGTGSITSGNGSAEGISYADMTAPAFRSRLGSAFLWKTFGDSHPYNLREHLNLVVYSFPGLAGLPHYGDWGAQFKEPSLVYYEQYGDGSCGFSGGNARYLIRELSDQKPIRADGYAVAFLTEDLGDAAEVKISLTTFDSAGGQSTTDLTFPKNQLILTTGKNDEGNEASYYLALLPAGLVNDAPANPHLYGYLKFVLDINGDTLSGEYFYNPHFAETVIPYVPEEGQTTVWTAESAADYAKELLSERPGVSLRTPRHLYSLSRFEAYCHSTEHSFLFRQELNLDYASYTGYGLFSQRPFRQAPIGSWAAPFNGVYDGGCHTITGVTFYLPADSSRFYAGLFGFSSGTLQNIVYQLNPQEELTLAAQDGSQNLYAGPLAGGSSGLVQNCAVWGTRLTGYAFGAAIYAGGLVGQNSGIIRACGAESARLSVEGSNYARVYAGGLVGENAPSGSIAAAYAIGQITAVTDTTSQARICGFAGQHTGSISASYAAANLTGSGGVELYGFCVPGSGSEEHTFFLDGENFTHRGTSYAANFAKPGDTASPVNYAALSAPDSSVPGMGKAASGGFPYPTAVRDGSGAFVHYGQWPIPMELGEMGVYYWEQLDIGGTVTCHVNLLAVDPNRRTIVQQSTLSTAHSDDGVVTGYGYGYYEKDGSTAVSLRTTNILYSSNGNQGAAVSRNTPTNSAVNGALAALMPGFTFHSYDSFVPAVNGGSNSGLYPTGTPNGTFMLTQAPVTVTFAVNPHFAGALSVQTTAGWTVNAPTAAPGSADNHYGVRSVAQLEFINWNRTTRNTRTVLETNQNYMQFPYLSTSASTGKYHWTQSHDLNGGGITFTPIAEYYDTTNGNQGKLYGWFGDVYDGDDYVIENLSIQGQKSSCAGLFGVVYNGTLKNIILYDSRGQGLVTAGHYDGTQGQALSYSRWYAIGGLAGLAASHTGSAVVNCSVAGYTIQANVFTYRIDKDDWGGCGIGGLVGISVMPLTGCSAVTDIVLPATATSNDNVRVGGLAGACQQSITDCYAGGSITISPDLTIGNDTIGIYVGGIVGGSYLKPLEAAGNLIGVVGTGDGNSATNETNNALTNCYSYVTLPAQNTHKSLKALYALGGTGEINSIWENRNDGKANHGVCTITNSFYLNSIKPTVTASGIKTDVNGTTGVTELSHRQLTGQAPIGGQTIYQLLTGFSPVTSEIGGFSVAGKYSFPPASSTELQGMDYPFPTVLTQENGAYHVHYGAWPVYGIRRASGGAPVALDLLTRAEAVEHLELSGVEPGGTWQAVSSDDTVAAAKVENGTLTVTAIGPGTTKLTVRYTYGGTDYTLTLTVNVTARLALRPAAVRLFLNDAVSVPLLPCGREPVSGAEQPLSPGGLSIAGISCDSQTVTAAMGADAGQPASLTLTSGGDAGEAAVNLNYTYTYNGIAYQDAGAVTVTVLPSPNAAWAGNTFTVDLSGYGVTDLTASLPDGTFGYDQPQVSGETVVLKQSGPDAAETSLTLTLTMDGLTHTLTVAVPVRPMNPTP